MLFYAASTHGFYDSAIHGENIPEDAVEVSKEEHRALLDAQANGKIITPDATGYPVAVDYVLSPEEVRQNLIGAALEALATTDMVFIRCGKAGIAWPVAWQSYVVALRAIVNGSSEATELPEQPEYPEGA